jgi:hypothetical protein
MMEEVVKTNAIDYEEEKRYCSGIGLRYFVLSLVFTLVQISIIPLTKLISRDILDTYYLLLTMIPVYLILIPVCYGLFKNLTYKPLPKNKFSAGQIIQAFFIAFAFMYIGNIIGTILNCFFFGACKCRTDKCLAGTAEYNRSHSDNSGRSHLRADR